MVKVLFTILLTLYLSIWILGLLIFWIIEGRRKGYEGSALFENIYTWQCSICTHTYVDSIHNLMSVCPRCGSYNKREEVKEE